MAILWNKNPKSIKELIGIVSSDKMSKTRVVVVQTDRTHPKYRKTYKVQKKYYIHDESDASLVGDTVRFREATPLSRLKRRNLVEIVTKAQVI